MRISKMLLSLAIVLFAVNAEAQFLGETGKQIFKVPGLDDSLAKHKNVAIIPFRATIAYKRLPKKFDAASNAEEEKKMGVIMQRGMYTYLLRKDGKYTVSFQDVERTNILLKQAGVYDKLEQILPDSLAKILKVDAIIKCSYAYEKTGSEGGAIAKAVLLGGAGKTGSGTLTMQIDNSIDGKMLWRFYKEMNETFTSSGNEVMERMMRKVSRNFPYEK
jgi:hypothetical protein